jgi:hypothetical protein
LGCSFAFEKVKNSEHTMDNKEAKPQAKITMIAGIFAIITAIISGSFLILNTVIEHNLSLSTETPQFTTPLTVSPTPTRSTTTQSTAVPNPKKTTVEIPAVLLLTCAGGVFTVVLIVLLFFGILYAIFAFLGKILEKIFGTVWKKRIAPILILLGIIIIDLMVSSSVGTFIGTIFNDNPQTGMIWGVAISIGILVVVVIIFFWNPFRRNKK